MKAKFNEWMKEIDTSNMTMENAPEIVITFAKRENEDGSLSEEYYLSAIDRYQLYKDKVLNTFLMFDKNCRLCGCNSYLFDKDQRMSCDTKKEKYVEGDSHFVPFMKSVVDMTYED